MKDARERAAAYLNIKPRTKMQVIRYLKSKGYEEDEINDAVTELEEYRYIDDFSFSVMYFQYGFEKGRGIMRIKRELAEKGVDHDIIDASFEELEAVPDQFEAALEIAEDVVSGIDVSSLEYDEKRRLQAKIGRRLVSRGFSSDVVYKVINRIV